MQRFQVRTSRGARRVALSALVTLALSPHAVAEGTQAAAAPEVDAFNYILGTQAIGGRYHFTEDTPLVESAKRIRELGSNIMKFTLSREGSFGDEKGNVPGRNPGLRSLTELAAREPSHRAVLDMPFTYYFLWTYTFGTKTSAGRFKATEHDAEYREMYDFARHLLGTYDGSGKHFYLGHWEGDWHLRPHFDPKQPFPPGYGEAFTEWLRVRQKAIDDAKRDTPHANVWLWHYTEVNLVEPYLKGGQCIASDILPNVDVDYVSYSCYDALQRGIRDDLFATLDFIESKLRPRPGIAGKRVFIGEYGFPTRRYNADVQNQKSIAAMRAGIEWGCPFVLYWELYCNEVRDGKRGGFWLIDDKGEKQPVYFTHQRYFDWARKYVAAETKRTGQTPTDKAFRAAALEFLASLANRNQ